MLEIFRGKIVDVSLKSYTLLITGDEEKINAFINLIRPLGIKELVRTGPVAMARGDKVIKVKEKQSQGGEENG
jgi:acetolactate synthase-1/3 small subunit